MAGVPIAFSGNQRQPPTATDATPKYYPTNATIAALLPYNGQAPSPAYAPYTTVMNGHPESSAPIDTTYLYPPNPNSHSHFPSNPQNSNGYPASSAAPPSPFPLYSTATPQFYGGYPPNPDSNHSTPAFAYPPKPFISQVPSAGYLAGPGNVNYNYPPAATSAYPPPSIYQQHPHPTSQSQPYAYGTYTYPPPPHSSGIYPAPPPPYGGGGDAYPPRHDTNWRHLMNRPRP